ncbi:MAG: PrsW family intramembrane metalloprotease [Candidatus Fermentibacteraceae bacterium]|nr:PrsW family intramembrane metalloprotease [Candidatus Fermentibacteraceae bacterium]MBN2608261.1 PrsW family intramembrane metalloprotease [Candidatus Fermentibacteraceae bacterium]
MELAISLGLAVIPSLLIVYYFRRKDRARPEPGRAVTVFFLLGLLSTLPAIIIELALGSLGSGLEASRFLYPPFKAFIIAGLVEEGLKLFLVMRFAYRKHFFDEVMDGIVITVVAGMGFACLENVLYVLGRGMTVGFLRAFTSVPMHASVSAIMGYHIGLSRFACSVLQRRRLLLKGFLLAVFFHGMYNLCIFAIPYWTPLIVLGLPPVLIWSILLARKLVRAALAEDAAKGRISVSP